MKGFYYKKELKKKTKKKKSSNKNSKADKKKNCEVCSLHKNCITPRMKPTGHGKKEILFIAEAPGASEDEKGIQLIGRAGQVLRKTLDKFDFNLDLDGWKTNAIICRPPKNRKPTNKEINACRKNLMRTIRRYAPQKIVLLGKTALQAFLGHRTTKLDKIEKWIGATIPDQETMAWVFPTYHPSYILRDRDNKGLRRKFESTLATAIDWPVDFFETSIDVEIFKTEIEATIFLQSLLVYPEIIAIDYETTGVKPQADGHEIVCMSISTKTRTVAFPIFDDKEFLISLKKVLRCEAVKKIGQNIKYEHIWSKIILKTPIKGWYWDTMLAQHIINNTTGTTGLKYQGYVRFGVLGYDNEVAPYLTSKAKGGNTKNRIKECDPDKLMTYCGYDTRIDYMLYEEQIKEMDTDMLEAYNLFHDGILELAQIEMNGICLDIPYYKKQDKILKRSIEKLKEKIENSKEVALFKKKTGAVAFNPTSPQQLQKLLFDILNYGYEKTTPTGAPSTDQDALSFIDTPFTNTLLKLKKAVQLRGTFLAGFMREAINGKMHPSFNLNVARSFRSSSSNPNFQNVPKHDVKAQRIIRSGIIPSPGNQLLEVDYSKIEVCIAACCHKDPEMLKYLNNPDSDMHRDQAMELFLITRKQIDKDIKEPNKEIKKDYRYKAKTSFVFAEFYGDYYRNIAKNLWPTLDSDIKAHLKSKGIKTYFQFEKHVEEIERKFWEVKFKVFNKWRKDTWREYQKTGISKMATKFKCSDILDRKQAINRRVQGPAFHCLLWSLIRINRYLTRHKMKTKTIGQVHDSIIFDFNPKEKKKLFPIIRKIMCEDIKKEWPWIIVPLNIDADISAVDGNWFEMKGIKI